MKVGASLALAFLSTSVAAGNFVFPNDDGVQYAACLEELNQADANGDQELSLEEYEDFVQAYKERILCLEDAAAQDFTFNANHEQAFRSLACMCRCREGSDCCTGDRAHVNTDGSVMEQQRTWRQHYYLSTVCQVTDGSITEPRCSDLLVTQTTTASFENNNLEEGDKKNKSCTVVGAVVLGGLVALAFAFVVFKKKANKKKKAPTPTQPTKTLDGEEDESTVAATVVEDDKA